MQRPLDVSSNAGEATIVQRHVVQRFAELCVELLEPQAMRKVHRTFRRRSSCKHRPLLAWRLIDSDTHDSHTRGSLEHVNSADLSKHRNIWRKHEEAQLCVSAKTRGGKPRQMDMVVLQARAEDPKVNKRSLRLCAACTTLLVRPKTRQLLLPFTIFRASIVVSPLL